MIEYTLRAINYQRYMKSEAQQMISNMSNSQKQRTLDTIKTQQGIHNLTGQQYNTEMLQYVEKLLQGGSE